MTAVALTIAGSDPSGGAGIQADLKTFAAHGVYGASVITALTAQNTTGVFGIHEVSPSFVRAQADAVLDDLGVDAIKVGMLGDPETIEVIAAVLEAHPTIPAVIDPVMVAASGDPLLPPEAVGALRTRLLPLATLVTPNVFEAALLLDSEVAQTMEEMKAQAAALLDLGPHAVFLKGGRRREAAVATDVLATPSGVRRYQEPRIEIPRPHGTGCTLSSAIAAQLALGTALEDAVAQAKRYVLEALERAKDIPIGRGARPLIHSITTWRG